jgi:hypothetical protein
MIGFWKPSSKIAIGFRNDLIEGHGTSQSRHKGRQNSAVPQHLRTSICSWKQKRLNDEDRALEQSDYDA